MDDWRAAAGSPPRTWKSELAGLFPPGSDQVARWLALEDRFPDAWYARRGGTFHGRLREGDEALQHARLESLINALVAREPSGP